MCWVRGRRGSKVQRGCWSDIGRFVRVFSRQLEAATAQVKVKVTVKVKDILRVTTVAVAVAVAVMEL